MAVRLAVNGGSPAIPESITFRKWPPQLDAAGEQLVLDAIRQDNHSGGGPHVRMLEREFAEWNGNRHCVATCYGGAALHMCVAGCGVGAGDEIITTALSWTTSATCIIHHCAVPIFVDVDWESMQLDPAKIEEAITDRTKAILVVHYWGVACDMDAITAIAEKHGLKVIEDACQAHGTLYKGQKTGTLGDCAAFSFNQNKNLCGGEGGVFVTDNDAVLEKAKAVMSFSDMRPADAGRDYHQYGLGYKYGHGHLPAAFALAVCAAWMKPTRGQSPAGSISTGSLKGSPILSAATARLNARPTATPTCFAWIRPTHGSGAFRCQRSPTVSQRP